MITLSAEAVRELEAQDAALVEEIERNEKTIADLMARNRALQELRQHARGLLNASGKAPDHRDSYLFDGSLKGKTLGQMIEMALLQMHDPQWPASVTQILLAGGFKPKGDISASSLISTEMARLARTGRLIKTNAGYSLKR